MPTYPSLRRGPGFRCAGWRVSLVPQVAVRITASGGRRMSFRGRSWHGNPPSAILATAGGFNPRPPQLGERSCALYIAQVPPKSEYRVMCPRCKGVLRHTGTLDALAGHPGGLHSALWPADCRPTKAPARARFEAAPRPPSPAPSGPRPPGSPQSADVAVNAPVATTMLRRRNCPRPSPRHVSPPSAIGPAHATCWRMWVALGHRPGS